MTAPGEALTEPGAAHFSCTNCDTTVTIAVPLRARCASDGGVQLAVDAEAVDLQPFWDHWLNAHGPSLG